MTPRLSAAVGVLLAACSLGEGGIGVPQQREGEIYRGDRRELAGELVVAANGCLELTVDGVTYFVIWPDGSELDDRLRLPGGEVVSEGDSVTGTGALTPVAPLIADGNGYWANAIGYCAPGAAEVLVLDRARAP